MDPPSESNSADEGMSNNGAYNNYRRKYSNGSQAGAVQRSPSAPPLRSNSIDMPSLLNSPSYDDNSRVQGGEDVTNDDLQAMKNMIGDMKKDPSLLYRLSSLPGNDNTSSLPSSPSVGQHPLPNTSLPTSPGRGESGGIHMNMTTGSNSGKRIYTDDATEVSSLGMMSYTDAQIQHNVSSGKLLVQLGVVDLMNVFNWVSV